MQYFQNTFFYYNKISDGVLQIGINNSLILLMLQIKQNNTNAMQKQIQQNLRIEQHCHFMQMLTSVKQKKFYSIIHSFLSLRFLVRMIMCVLHVFVADLPQANCIFL